ncbi:MAG: V-type ATPase 116kDa subunit family protein [Candidatus Ancaeobacter aquaticus]|nr:V-type ATPase 116kDa subunit family protein [Candidatus Ancaeobacter aquaticus]
MSIVPLTKITLIGFLNDKEKILAGLQDIGCVHVEPLRQQQGFHATSAPEKEAYDALRFLLSCPKRLRQECSDKGFDPDLVKEQALEIKTKIHDLEIQLDGIRGRIAGMKPWGDFRLPSENELNGMKLWFYVVPHPLMSIVQTLPLVWKTVYRDQSNCFVIVISNDEPHGIPVLRTHAGTHSLSELERKETLLMNEAADLQSKRKDLTRWCDLYMSEMWRLENKADVEEVSWQTRDQEELFALRGWAPQDSVKKLQDFARAACSAIFIEEPHPDELPPTLLRNSNIFAGGADLVSFYMTPSYKLWDPSAIVFVSFAIFFAMIISDAGYGLVMGAIILWKWKAFSKSERGKNFRILCLALTATTIVWGIIVGSYFGLTLGENSFLGHLKIFDVNNVHVMMPLVIIIGMLHLILSNFCDAWRKRGMSQMYAPIGWAALIFGGGMFYVSSMMHAYKVPMHICGWILIGAGALMILLFTGEGKITIKRLLKGAEGLTRVSAVFGDILSYMRIFALGLAAVSLALTFNKLSKQVADALPVIGIFFAILILLFGHTLNFLLGIVSGFVHGLRLNFIEFFNWSMHEEGRPFKTFAKRKLGK